jgi:hypothetical protein
MATQPGCLEQFMRMFFGMTLLIVAVMSLLVMAL